MKNVDTACSYLKRDGRIFLHKWKDPEGKKHFYEDFQNQKEHEEKSN